MFEARCGHGGLALDEEDELARVGLQEVRLSIADLGIEGGPAEHRSVEGIDLLAELPGERACRHRELHVVEPHWPLLSPVLEARPAPARTGC